MTDNRQTKMVFILSVSSGIGLELAKRYLKDGWQVIGTYRNKKYVSEIIGKPNCQLFSCDITKKQDVKRLTVVFKKSKYRWNTFISCVGMLQPLARFFDNDFEKWQRGVHVNSIEQLRVLHALYPYRERKNEANVVFFAGSGTNNVVVHMSSYISSKIFLIKMCEFLDAENKDLNIFIVGPGWTRTKAHDEVIKDKNTPPEKFEETMDFLNSRKGTDFQDIYDCIHWLCLQGKKTASGRNFSVVHDQWKGLKKNKLVAALQADEDMYKLRRFKNNFLTKG